MHILILYATRHGHTKKIAEFLKDLGVSLGHSVKAVNASGFSESPAAFDRVVIASPIHIEKHHPSIRAYVKKYARELNRVKSAFLSISMTAAGTNQNGLRQIERITASFLSTTGWHPAAVEQVAGAVLYKDYNFLIRFIMKRISKKEGGSTDTSRNHVYTDWTKLQQFFAELVSGSVSPPPGSLTLENQVRLS